MATLGVGPEAWVPPPPRQSPSQYFSRLFFGLPLSLLGCSAFSAEAPSSPGPHHSLPKRSRKGSGAPAQRRRSLPFSTVPRHPESHISIWNIHPQPAPCLLFSAATASSCPAPCRKTGTGRSGPPWDTYIGGRSHQWCSGPWRSGFTLLIPPPPSQFSKG